MFPLVAEEILCKFGQCNFFFCMPVTRLDAMGKIMSILEKASHTMEDFGQVIFINI